MKASILIAILFTATTLFAEDITTLSGTKYQNVTVTRVEANGISISHDDGLAKIAFTDLSEELRSKYNYDPKKAAQFSQAEQAAAAQRAAAANAAATAAEKQKQIEKASQTIHISTEEVVAGGVIADRMNQDIVNYGTASSSARFGGGGNVSGGTMVVWRRSGTSIFVSGIGKVADGTQLTIQAYRDGVHTIDGRTLDKWVPIKVLPNPQ